MFVSKYTFHTSLATSMAFFGIFPINIFPLSDRYENIFVQKVNVIDKMTLNVGARAKIAHACIDLSREEEVFGI